MKIYNIYYIAFINPNPMLTPLNCNMILLSIAFNPMPKDFLTRYKRIDYLISHKATGFPKLFAAKLQLSRRMLFEYLADLKEMGAPI